MRDSIEGKVAASASLKLGDLLEEFDERLGERIEPEILTLTERMGFVSQRERFKKRLAIADTSNYRLIGINDIAFNPYLLWAGAVAQNSNWEAAIISPVYPTFHVRKGYNPRFVNYLLCSGFLRSRYDAISFGSVPRKRRTAVSDFLNVQIASQPSLPEQERLVGLLDEADRLRKVRAEADRRMAALLPSLFHEMFGDPLENRHGWTKQPISSFVREFQGGRNVNPAGADEATGQFRVLKISAVTWGKFQPEESKPISAGYQPPEAHFVRAGDLLFSRANTTELVGATSYVFETPPNLLLPDKLWRFVWKDPCTVEPLFIWSLFQSASVRRELGRRATGTGGSMKNISKPKVMTLEVTIPPLTLQKQFTQRAIEIGELKVGQAASRKRQEALFQSMLYRVFSGEL